LQGPVIKGGKMSYITHKGIIDETLDALISYNNKMCNLCKLKEICDDNELFCSAYLETALTKRMDEETKNIKNYFKRNKKRNKKLK